MRAHPFPFEGWTAVLRAVHVTRDEAFNGVPAERSAARGGKERVGRLPVTFTEPRREHADHVPLQGCAAVLAAFAFASQMRPGPQHDVTASQVNELGHAQSGLDREQYERAPRNPRRASSRRMA
jgi:hypothetical protein